MRRSPHRCFLIRLKCVWHRSMVAITEGKMAPFPGGILLKCATEGHVLGAVGISGASADEDEFCALEGGKLSSPNPHDPHLILPSPHPHLILIILTLSNPHPILT